MKRKKVEDRLDYHEGLSLNQAQIIIEGVGLNFKEFSDWMYGQTAPILVRKDEKGREITIPGIYEYDLIRYVRMQLFKEPTIWD